MKKSKFVRNSKKYQNGGQLESQYGQAGSAVGSMVGSGLGMAANALLPGLGSILSPVLSQVGSAVGGTIGGKAGAGKQMQQDMNALTVNKNPYGFAFGGALTGRSDASVYKGRLHSRGGILVNSKGVPSGKPDAEVEGGELAVTIGGKSYIFSNRLKI